MKNFTIAAGRLLGIVMAILFIAGCLQVISMPTYAKEATITVKGNVYEFTSEDHYEFSTSTNVPNGKHFGSFTISGNAKLDGAQNGISKYSVNSDNINFHYTYDSAKLAADETEWHLIEDKTKKVDDIALDEKILHGAIVVQSSKNGEDWITDDTFTNVFTEDTELPANLYETKDIQLENGCYYRVIVAYELQRKVGKGKILFFPTEE